MKRLIYLVSYIIFAFSIFATESIAKTPSKEVFLQKTQALHIPFIENKGQINEKVTFYAKTLGGTVFITRDGSLVYSLTGLTKNGTIQTVAIQEGFSEAKNSSVKGEGLSLTKTSYFKGSEKLRWRSNIPTYDEVSLGEIYEGINVKLRAYGNNVEKIFCVKPGKKPEKIKLTLNGAKDLKVNEKGELEAITESGIIKFTKPVAYQNIDGKQINIPVSYNLLNLQQPCTSKCIYGFTVSNYDPSKELIIDPLLASTFLGGSNDDYGYDLTIDELGNIFVSGFTYSSDFPVTLGVFDQSYADGDIFVAKLNSELTALLAATFIGGSSFEKTEFHGLATDGNGNIFIAGSTYSNDFPVTQGAYDTTYNGYADGFVSKLNNDLTSLQASTFIGGSSYDFLRVIVFDDTTSNLFITGNTSSTDFPTTAGAYDQTYNFGSDIFIAKLSSDLAALSSSTFVGGDNEETANALAIDSTGNIFIAGRTLSGNFLVTEQAYDKTLNGDMDAIIAKFDNNLSSLVASTYLGGLNKEEAYALAIDSAENVVVAGYTNSGNFPTTSGVYDGSYNGDLDVFVTRLNNSLTTLMASTFIGGSLFDHPYALAIDTAENIVVAGYTLSTDYPTTQGAYDRIMNGGDVFISKLDKSFAFLKASTFIGGGNFDQALSLALDSSGNLIVSGTTESSDYPTTTDAYDTSFNGTKDVFISKLTPDLSAEATKIDLASFTATPLNRAIIVEWATETETDNAGFNIYRADSENGNYLKINSSLISAKGSSTQGASYRFEDTAVRNRKTFYYKLEDIDLNGQSTMHGPVSATPRWLFGIFGK
jgi:hypothetical protein